MLAFALLPKKEDQLYGVKQTTEMHPLLTAEQRVDELNSVILYQLKLAIVLLFFIEIKCSLTGILPYFLLHIPNLLPVYQGYAPVKMLQK